MVDGSANTTVFPALAPGAITPGDNTDLVSTLTAAEYRASCTRGDGVR
jgi:hypothetical protein